MEAVVEVLPVENLLLVEWFILPAVVAVVVVHMFVTDTRVQEEMMFSTSSSVVQERVEHFSWG
jgi:uncharacterized membrane protein